ncbi:MAG TPA: 3-oxoacyl-ACP reductase [Planctomycetaceae bacterium]|nr:3-oxoacyl-ACP reductase [Planctomycetaceae bacterium]HRF01148.1 SDR family oxidoreductase [Pirellulaceae bacterium]
MIEPHSHATVPPDRLPLAGRRIVVTGASSGIGRATAIRLARSGAALLLHARQNVQGLAETLLQVRDLSSAAVDHASLLADLSTEEGCERLVADAFAAGPIDAWVHLAGADVLTGAIRSAGFDAKLDLLWRTDVLGTMRTCRAVGRRLAEQPDSDERPAIVTVGWDQVAHGMAGDAGEMFGAIKGAVTAFSLSLARTLAPRVRVAVVAPGWIRTSWGEQADPYWDRRAREESLAARWGTPEDVAGAIAWLVGPDARFVTGQVIAVNGGFRHAYDPAG